MAVGLGKVIGAVVKPNGSHCAGVGRLGGIYLFALVNLPCGLVDEDLVLAADLEPYALGGILCLTGAGVEYYSALVGEVLVDFIDVKTGSAVKFHIDQLYWVLSK